MQNNKGFSLLELLIVITIIGLLSTIILSSVSNSRARAYDSKIKQQLGSFRTAAEVYFTNVGNYGPAASNCSGGIFVNEDAVNGRPKAYIQTGALPSFSQVYCGSSDTAYSVKATLYSGTDYWCVDNKGAAKSYTGTPTHGGTICS